MLPREEYVEQAYFFRALKERSAQNLATQELLESVKEELLATTKLPLAVGFLATELRQTGGMATAMAAVPHYFSPFQTFLVAQAEDDRSRFDFAMALELLHREAGYRAEAASPQGVFLFQFETLCRHRLRYDRGLEAMQGDPIYDAAWRDWLATVRRQIGLVDLADLIYVRSDHYRLRPQHQPSAATPEPPPLFGEKEGKIALAHRHKDPLYFFAALQRHLGYPTVPRVQLAPEEQTLLHALSRRMERVEARLKLLEEEQRGGIDLARFMRPEGLPPPEPGSSGL